MNSFVTSQWCEMKATVSEMEYPSSSWNSIKMLWSAFIIRENHCWGSNSSVVKCPPLNWKVRSIATERSIHSYWVIAVAFLGQERSPQPPWQEAQFRLQPVVKCHHQNLENKKTLLWMTFFYSVTCKMNAEGQHEMNIYNHWQGPMESAPVNNFNQWSGWWHKYAKQASLRSTV